MGIMLPSSLSWVLNMIGVSWPDIDEDDLRSGATELRTLAGELESHTGDAKNGIQQMMGTNSARSLDIFDAMWSKIADGHLPQFKTALDLFADGLDVSAVLVVGLKVAAIGQLVALAAEIIADQAAAPLSFGASEAAIPVEVGATRMIVKQLVKKAVDAVEQQLMDVVKGEAFSVVSGAAGEMGTQLLADAVGVGHGVDLGAAAKAGAQKGLDSLDSLDPSGANPEAGQQ